MNKFVSLIMVAFFAILLLFSCKEKAKIPQSLNIDGFVQGLPADTIIFEAGMSSDYERMIMLADSFYKIGEIPEIGANRWKATAYEHSGNNRASEFYCKKVLEIYASLENPNAYEWLNYRKSVRRLSELLMLREDYEGALEVAVPALYHVNLAIMGGEENLEKDKAILLNVVSCSQLNTFALSEAEKNYEEVYNLYKESINNDSTVRGVSDAYSGIIIIIQAYINVGHYSKTIKWLERADSILNIYANLSSYNEKQYMDLNGKLALKKAIIMQHLGLTDKATQWYDMYEKTDYGQTPEGRLDATTYLYLAGRFQEAADNYEYLDEVMGNKEIPYTLNNIQSYLLPKLRANIKAHRRDTIYAIESKLTDQLDNAIKMAKRDESAELAILYGVEEKESEIAQQRTKVAEQQRDINRQYFITAIIIIALLLVFFVVYANYRKRAETILAKANQQLENANSELDHKNKDLAIATARAEESSRLKSHFIEQMSHEVRTPLNILSGFTQVICTPGIQLEDDEKEEISNGIVENTKRITGLINKMLELSEVANNDNFVIRDKVTARQIAEMAISNSGIEQATHLRFKLIIHLDIEDQTITTNLANAARALSLILDNAVKFTLPAEAAVKNNPSIVKYENADLTVKRKSNMVAFIVTDSGIGIPAEEAEHIFDEFVQLDDYYDGTGIGLTIARSIARRLGGDILLDTTYMEKGARFIFQLPIE